MPATFTGALARRLDGLSRSASSRSADAAAPTRLRLYRPRRRRPRRRPARARPRRRAGPSQADYPWHPSTDRLVRTPWSTLPAQLIGVLMTGMGTDGAEAMTLLRAQGGRTIAEAEETAVVWGMPGELVKAGGADWVLPLPEIAGWLRSWCPDMPLIRKPSSQSPAAAALPALWRGHERGALGGRARRGRKARRARAARRCPGAESDPRVREAIFTGLARLATPESAAVVVPYLRSDDARLRTGALDALRAMPEACRPHLPALLADRDPDVRLLACELARELPAGGHPPAVRPARAGDRDERLRRRGRGAGGGRRARSPAGPRPLRTRFAGEPFLAFRLKVATERIAAPARDRPCVRSSRSRRRNSARSASSSIGAPACSSPRPSATMSSAGWPSAWPPRDRALPQLLRPSAQRHRRRGRAVHQRLHRQRDLLLPRGPPAPLPDLRPAGRTRARQAAGRGDPDLVGALLHRRGALLDRHLAAGELAGGRRPRHRDRRLRHRHPAPRPPPKACTARGR